MALLTPCRPKFELKIMSHLTQSIESELMDRFWCSRCLNNFINLSDMIGSLASGVTNSLVAKIGAKTLSPPFEDRFWCSRCLNDCIYLPDMIGSLVSGSINSLVAKIGTKRLSHPFEDRFWCSRYLNNRIKVPDMVELFVSGPQLPWWWIFELNNPR